MTDEATAETYDEIIARHDAADQDGQGDDVDTAAEETPEPQVEDVLAWARDTPDGRAWLASPEGESYIQAVAEMKAVADAAGDAEIHRLEERLGRKFAPAERERIVKIANELTPAVRREYGANATTVERVMDLAGRQVAGRESYSDIVARHAARAGLDD